MKKELEQLAESVFGGWNDAALSIAKESAQVHWGSLSEYLINELIKSAENADINYVRYTGENNGIYRNPICTSPEMNSNVLTKRNNSTVADRYLKAEYLRGSLKDGKAAKNGRAKTNFDSYLSGKSREDAQFANLPSGTYVLENEFAEQVKNKFGSAYSVYGAAAGKILSGVAESLISITAFNSNIADAEKRRIVDFGDTTGDLSFSDTNKFSFESNAFSKQKNVSESNTLSKSREVFAPSLEYKAADEESVSRRWHSYDSKVDMNAIEEALARKLHEQVVSGFPMYMR